MFTELWRIREVKGGKNVCGKLKNSYKILDGKPKKVIPAWRLS